MLEHILEYHFEQFFPLVEVEIKRGNAELRHTLKMSWKLGRSETPQNAARWEALLAETA